MPIARVAVTGITSGVGLRFAEIALERGLSVRGLVRDPARADAQRLRSLGVELVTGDLDAEPALLELARGADALFHFAAHVGDRGKPEEFVRINVGGTRRVLTAAARAAVPRVVHLSSTAVYGRPDHGTVTESWPTKHSGAPYDDTKVDAERTALAVGHELGLAVSAIRPPIIYGPYDRNFMPRAREALAKGRFLLIDGGRAPLNVVWVDHVVDVCLLAADSPAATGQAFNVMDEVAARPPSVREVGETLADALGVPRPTRVVPYSVAYAVGSVVAKVFELRGGDEPPPLSPFVVKILTRDVTYDSSKAADLLGWKPKVRALDGLRREAEAFAARRQNGA